VSVDEATIPQVLTEEFDAQKRMNESEFILFTAVAAFYDGKGYVRYDYSQGRKISRFICIGTEAQQIQTKLYFEFLKDCMEKDCEKSYQGEKVLADILGKEFTRAGFKVNFNKAFAAKVRDRLIEMKHTREDHEHKQYTAVEIDKIKLRVRKSSGASGYGGQLGGEAGSNVSLHKQAGGSKTLTLSGS
jgi:hypothetical protein